MTTDIQITAEMPIELPLPPIKPGADWDWTLEVTDDNGVAVDTTNYTLSITGKSEINGETIFTLTIESGITHTAALGKFAMHISGATTALYDVRRIVWDSLLTTAGGVILPIFQGIENPIEVLPKIG